MCECFNEISDLSYRFEYLVGLHQKLTIISYFFLAGKFPLKKNTNKISKPGAVLLSVL